MSKVTWSHEVLGELTHGSNCWVGEIGLPGFAKFDLPLPVGRYELAIELVTPGENEPSQDLVRVAEQLVEMEAQLADALPLAIWRELSGEGPDSGMWWYGGISSGELTQLTGPDAPQEPEDLVDWIELQGVGCGRHSVDGKPSAVFRFATPWEEEHGGIGVLVERGIVTGIGYGCDCVLRFGEKPPEKPKLSINPFTGEPLE